MRAARYHVRHAGLAHRTAEGLHLGLRLRGFVENNVRPFSLEIATARQRFLRTVYCPRVRACQDQDVALCACLDCRTDLHAGFLPRDHLLAFGVAAFLRAHLIFDHDRRGAGARIFDDRALHVERIAIAGVAVANDGKAGDGAATAPHAVQHLGE